MMNIEDLEDQLTVKPPPEGDRSGRHEAQCHICPWTYFRDTDDDARAFLRSHIIDAHLRPGAHDPLNVETGQSTAGWIKKNNE